MPRDCHTEFSLTAESSCTINKESAEARLSRWTDAHCVFPGETNHFCYFPSLSLPSMSPAMSNYHFYLSFSPKRHYYIRQNMDPISVLVVYYFFPSPSIWAFTKSVPSAVSHLTHSFACECTFPGHWSGFCCFLTTCRIHLLFRFLLFSCYFLFYMSPPPPVWRHCKHENLILSISLWIMLFKCDMYRCTQNNSVYETGNMLSRSPSQSKEECKLFLFSGYNLVAKPTRLCKAVYLFFQRYLFEN